MGSWPPFILVALSPFFEHVWHFLCAGNVFTLTSTHANESLHVQANMWLGNTRESTNIRNLLFDKELLGTEYVTSILQNPWDTKVQKAEVLDIMVRDS